MDFEIRKDRTGPQTGLRAGPTMLYGPAAEGTGFRVSTELPPRYELSAP